MSKTVARALRLAFVVAATAAAHPSLADDIAVERGEAEPTAPTRTIWDGIFSEAQATRGQAVYTGPCSRCHGYKLDGAPDDPDMVSTRPVAGAKFLRDWDGRTLAALFDYVRATMPENNPASLTNQEFADVIAYMLRVSGAPAGDRELEPDVRSLARLVVRQPSQLEPN